MSRILICSSVLILALGLALATPAQASTYTTGDVFASLVGQVQELKQTGAAVQTLMNGLSGFTTGSAFDKAGNFYVTDFAGSYVQVFANNPSNTSTTFNTGSTVLNTPEAIAFDAA